MQKNYQEKIEFRAIFAKATTTIDGGWRISLDVALDDSDAVLALAKLTQELLKITIKK